MDPGGPARPGPGIILPGGILREPLASGPAGSGASWPRGTPGAGVPARAQQGRRCQCLRSLLDPAGERPGPGALGFASVMRFLRPHVYGEHLRARWEPGGLNPRGEVAMPAAGGSNPVRGGSGQTERERCEQCCPPRTPLRLDAGSSN